MPFDFITTNNDKSDIFHIGALICEMGSMNVSPKQKPKKLDSNMILVQLQNTRNIGSKRQKTHTDSLGFSISGKDLNENMHQFMCEVFWFNKTMKPSLRPQSHSVTSQYTLSTIYEDYLKGLAFKNLPRNLVPRSYQNSGLSIHKRNDLSELPRKYEPICSKQYFKPTFYAQPEMNLDYESQLYRRTVDIPVNCSSSICEYDVMEVAKPELNSQKRNDILQEMLISTLLNKAWFSKKYDSKYDKNIPNTCNINEKNVGTNRVIDVSAKDISQLDGNSPLFDAKSREILMKQFQSIIKPDLIKPDDGREHFFPPQKEIIYSHSDEYVEYSNTGKVIRGQDRVPFRSKSLEDTYHNNYTAVDGLYFGKFKQAYSYCASTLENSYSVEPVETGYISFDLDISSDKNDEDVEEEFEKSSNNNAQDEKNIESNRKPKRKHVFFCNSGFPAAEETEQYQMKRTKYHDFVEFQKQ